MPYVLRYEQWLSLCHHVISASHAIVIKIGMDLHDFVKDSISSEEKRALFVKAVAIKDKIRSKQGYCFTLLSTFAVQ
jgi:hypothetical protein